jgi:hypothetical protein
MIDQINLTRKTRLLGIGTLRTVALAGSEPERKAEP